MTKPRLYGYQKRAVRTIIKHNGLALLADDMGLGKTWEALGYCKKCPEKRPIIVVCPANVKWIWEVEARHLLRIRGVVLSGQIPPKEKLISIQELYIINYEILQFWVPYLKKLQPQILIIDECHYIKSRGAKRTRAVGRLRKNIAHFLPISGTPMLSRPAELYSVLHMLWPQEFPSFQAFGHRYCKAQWRPWGWEYKGASNVKELHRKLKRLGMIRNLKKDVLKDLPDKTRSVIPVEIENRGEYREAETNFITWLTKKSSAKAKRAARAQQLVQLGYLKRLAADLKMKMVMKWIEDFLEQSSGKLVLYAIHKKIIKQIHEKYPKISVVIDGSTSHKNRKRAVKTFQHHSKIRLFIGNIRAAGVGITLTAAHTLAFVELDWVPGNHTQAEDRIHRIGQKNAAMIYYLVAKDTIEEKLCKIIQKKQRILSRVLDGSIKKNKLDVFKSLNKALLKGKVR